MNKRMELEMGEKIIEKQGHRWKVTACLRKDFEAEKGAGSQLD